LAQKKLGAPKKLASPRCPLATPNFIGIKPTSDLRLGAIHACGTIRSPASEARRRRAIFGVRAAVPKGCIWSNFWRNGATQKWRHRVFFIAVQRICAFAGMPGARRHDESVTKGRNTASSGGWRQ
jgi:hypothetical protein